MDIYFAGPLFSESERNWIRDAIGRIQALAAESDGPVKIVWPFELFQAGGLDALGDKAQYEVFRRCRDHLEAAGMVIALLDGALVDDGTAWEIGYRFAARSRDSLLQK